MAKNVKIGDTTPVTLTLQNASVDAGGDPTITIYISTSNTPIINAATMTEHIDSVSRSKWQYNWDTTGESAGEYLSYIDFEVDTVAQEIEKEIIVLSDNDFDSIKTTADSIETKVDTVDTVVDAIRARTDLIATAAEDNSAHGSGSWATSGQGSGLIGITVNAKVSSVNIEGVKVTVHNSDNDDSPFFGPSSTNVSGNTAVFNLDDDTSYYVRASKPGYTFSDTLIAVTDTGTKNITGTALTITAPSDPELCRLYLFPITLGNGDITSLRIFISSKNKLTKVNGEYIKNTKSEFTYDSSTNPDSFYFDAVQTAAVNIRCDELGLDHNITIPSSSTADLDDLI